MKDSSHQKIYCKSALFTCICCQYACTIYSDEEWLEPTTEEFCGICLGSDDPDNFFGKICRDDLLTEFANLPLSIHNCEKNIQLEKVHWTALLVECPRCKKDSMLFTKFNIGTNILKFYEKCVELAKPAHPSVSWLNPKGEEKFLAGGQHGDFSASW